MTSGNRVSDKVHRLLEEADVIREERIRITEDLDRVTTDAHAMIFKLRDEDVPLATIASSLGYTTGRVSQIITGYYRKEYKQS